MVELRGQLGLQTPFERRRVDRLHVALDATDDGPRAALTIERGLHAVGIERISDANERAQGGRTATIPDEVRLDHSSPASTCLRRSWWWATSGPDDPWHTRHAGTGTESFM